MAGNGEKDANSESDLEIIDEAEPLNSEDEKLVERHQLRRQNRLEALNRPRQRRDSTPERVRQNRAMSERSVPVSDVSPEGAVYEEMLQDRKKYVPETQILNNPSIRVYLEDEKVSEKMVESFRQDFSVPPFLRRLDSKVFLTIFSHLEETDKTCLALTCKYMMRVGRLHQKQNGPLGTITVPWEIQREFLARIRPLSIFGTPDKDTWRICESCRRLRPRDRRQYSGLRKEFPNDPQLRDDLWETNPTFVKGWAWGATTRCPTCTIKEVKLKLETLAEMKQEQTPKLKPAGTSAIQPHPSKKRKAPVEKEAEEVDYMDMIFE